MLLIPMGVIVVNTWFGFFWRESSPATRFGTSGILGDQSLLRLQGLSPFGELPCAY
jgi:hypothetical protein